MYDSDYELAGHIGVDAGLCWIGDPCYIIHAQDLPRSLGKTWLEFCENLWKGKFDNSNFQSFQYSLGHEGVGVCVSTGYGDGLYPVYVKKNSEGRVVEAKVVFVGEDEEEEEENDYEEEGDEDEEYL